MWTSEPVLFSNRTHRRLVRSLRELAGRTSHRRTQRRRFDVLLQERVSLVRNELLEIASLLDDELEPDPGCVVALHRLLTDGCASPLYNRDIHPSELRATLHYVRCRLGTSADSLPSDHGPLNDAIYASMDRVADPVSGGVAD